MSDLHPKIRAYADHIIAQVTSGALEPEAAADDIAQIITAALNNDENVENLLMFDPE